MATWFPFTWCYLASTPPPPDFVPECHVLSNLFWDRSSAYLVVSIREQLQRKQTISIHRVSKQVNLAATMLATRNKDQMEQVVLCVLASASPQVQVDITGWRSPQNQSDDAVGTELDNSCGSELRTTRTKAFWRRSFASCRGLSISRSY